MALDENFLLRLRDILGPQGVIESAEEKAPYLSDERELFQGYSEIVLRPANTEEVAAVARLCHEAGVPLVPQGGNTGYMGGATPDPQGGQLLLSLARMNKIRAVDPLDNSMTVEAGCILATIQAAAAEVDRLFPLSLGAEGSCQIGGNLSTNAGGVNVLRYGNTRDLVLGLEVVLPDGRVLEGLRALRKDNTGYDLKHLFIGAEGTLGIITAAVLKLYPRPKSRMVALIAVPAPRSAIALLARFKAASGDSVSSFEYMKRSCLDLVLEHLPDTRDPLGERHDHYVLAELATGDSDEALQALTESTLAEALEEGEALDAVIATSEQQAAAIWRLRESIPEAQKRAGGSIKHDVSVPVSLIPELLERGQALLAERLPDAIVVPFGHIGDGNIHFNLTQPASMARHAFLAQSGTINRAMHDLVRDLGGSFSAEHGIGQLKKTEMGRYKDPLELELMGRIKAALDPKEQMNPGKVLE